MSFVLYFTNNGAICKTFYVKALRNLRNIINRVCRNNSAVKTHHVPCSSDVYWSYDTTLYHMS